MLKRRLGFYETAIRKWRHFRKTGPPAPSRHSGEFAIRVLPSDLYNPQLNLIDHLIPDEEELSVETVSAEEARPEKSSKRSGFLDSLLEEVGSLAQKLKTTDRRVQAVEESRSDFNKKIKAILEEIEAVKQRTGKDPESLRDRELLQDVLDRVEEISSRYADREQLSGILARVDEVREASAGRELVDELSERVEEVRDGTADRGSLDRLAAQVDEIKAAADTELVEELSSRVEKLSSEAVAPELVDQIAAEVDEIRETSVDPGLVHEISGRIDRIERLNREAERELFDRVLARVEEMTSQYADRDALAEVSARIEEIRKSYTGRSLLGKIYDHVEVIGSNFADRTTVNSLVDQVEEIASKYAGREALEELSSEVEDIRSHFADREELAKAQKRIEEIGAKYARRKSVDRLKSEVEDLRERAAERGALEAALGKIEEIEARCADREAVAKIKDEVEEIGSRYADRETMAGISAQLVDIRTRYAKRNRLDDLAAELDEVSKRLAEAERLQETFQERQQALSELESVDESGRFAAMAQKLIDLEQAVGELHEHGGDNEASAAIGDRLAGLERELSRMSASLPDGEAAAPAGEAVETEPAFERIERVEVEQREFRRQMRKSLEAASAKPMRELENIKAKLALIEQSRPKAVLKPRFPTIAMPPMSLSWSRLMLIMVPAFVAAMFIGTIASYWLSELQGSGAGLWGDDVALVLGEGVEAPNIVYDDIEMPLQSPTLEIGAEWLTLTDGKVDIAGYAPGAVHAYLYLNNKEVEYRAVEEREFRFEQAPLEYGVNVIEVKVVDEFGNEANSMASIIERESRSMAKVRYNPSTNRIRGPRWRPYIALTIDAGASSRRAEKVLDVLRDKDIITTIFLTGRFVERYPDIVQRIVAEGHEVGNHTYSHPHLTTFETSGRHHTAPGVTKETMSFELIRTKELFESLTGTSMSQWWRAPYGEHNREILAWAAQFGFKHVDWTRSPVNHDILDWVSNTKNRYYLDGKGLLKRLTGIDSGGPGQANGSIILTHLGTDRKKDFLDEVLPKAIDELRSRDYKFVTVSRMFPRQ
jgi:peptidoglycan/xylan/chitin deacetylase (PgdA/CDA1 family)